MKLSPIEKQILCRIAVDGQTVEQIALAMDCHKNTVNNHIATVKKRFGCVSLPQLCTKLTAEGFLNE